MKVKLAAAGLSYERGDYIDALTLLSDLVDDSRNPDVLTLLAETFEKLGFEADAADLFAEVAQARQDDALLRRAAKLFAAAGVDDRAQLYGMMLFERKAHDATIAFNLAKTLRKGDDPRLAGLVLESLAESDDEEHLTLAADISMEDERNVLTLDIFKKLAARDPDDPYRLFNLLSVARNFCDYETIETIEKKLTAALRMGDPAVLAGELPYGNLLYCEDERINRLATNNSWGRLTASPMLARQRRLRPHRWGEKIRVGYLSSDFWEQHATMILFQRVLELHDRDSLEVTLYCYTPPHLKAFDKGGRERWGWPIVSLLSLSDAEAAETIRRDGIDILVDLKGPTSASRSAILNQMVAPVQVAWLGFPGSGLNIDCDYVIGDPIVLPSTARPYYHEKFCRLPESYQPNDPVHRPLPAPKSRTELGLPEDRFVFAAFNTPRKIGLAVIDSWAAILRAKHEALLWVMIDGDTHRTNFLKAIAARGVAAERILFAPKMAYADHLARLQAADLALDTFPYNGHTTTSDQLWAGLPVLTVKGTNFASRVSESLLTSIGLPDLVAPDQDAFVARAVELAKDRQAIAAYKARIAENRFRSPLFDAERFCRHLEIGYRMMADSAKAGAAPDHFDVPALPPRAEPFA
ncbi:hypothetical protein BJF93_00630 [Xaviernesmea oryzae]|uniref:O-GlcNAc transferase C-terminal domain-containing protein n=1 Tax=Xaviernesmea oryzae TaxID=464029 RepID=A0A1Q9B0H4_9HYPH|nr:hypothetical protein [Xaviernesmea oryzae]OLP61473.1 hypothetical protein BJF93_00630 [Xaviernesmea oryzae]SEL68199.1 Predicted O-linked N-acetylglucosamine transferase, SPINDLY family [Xaviernesmea oryzae]